MLHKLPRLGGGSVVHQSQEFSEKLEGLEATSELQILELRRSDAVYLEFSFSEMVFNISQRA